MNVRPAMTLLAILACQLLALAAAPAQAQTSHAEVCRAQSIGLAHTMKTALGLEQPRDVALDQAGLRAGGPRRQLADHAYTRLAGGASLDTVTREVHARCLQADRDALVSDAPDFGAQADGAGAQLCADASSSIASFLDEEPGMLTAGTDKLLDRFTNSRPHGDVNPRPILRRMLELAQRQARDRPEREHVAGFVMSHCRALTRWERAALEAEFYY